MDSQYCDNCCKNSMVSDDFGGCIQLVCEECGTVKTQGSYHAPSDQSTMSSKNDAFWNSSQQLRRLMQQHKYSDTVNWKVTEGKKLGERRIKEISAALNLNGEMKQSALDLYDKLIKRHGEFCYTHLRNKEILASACVYIVCRQHGWPVTLTSMASISQCSVYDLGKFYKEILKALNITLEAQDIVDLVPSCLKNCNFDETWMLEITKLVELCKETWISSGRQYHAVIYAAAYLVWQSKSPKEQKTSISKFVSKFKLSKLKANLCNYVRQIKSVLFTLAKEVPWLTEVNPHKVQLHITDILTYQKSLLASVLTSLEDDLVSDNSENDSTCNPTKRKGSSAILPKPFKKARVNSEGQNDTCSEESISIPSHSNLDSEFLTEEDIPESELGDYIRQEEEIQKIKRAFDVKL